MVELITDRFHRIYNQGVAVCGQPPARRVLHFDDDEERTYFVSLPRVLFSVTYKQFRGVFSSQRVHVCFTQNSSDQPCFPCLTNVDAGLIVCMKLEQKSKTLPGLLSEVVGDFWRSRFDISMTCSFDVYCATPSLCSFANWQRTTRRYPKWVPSSLVPADLTFEQFSWGSFVPNSFGFVSRPVTGRSTPTPTRGRRVRV